MSILSIIYQAIKRVIIEDTMHVESLSIWLTTCSYALYKTVMFKWLPNIYVCMHVCMYTLASSLHYGCIIMVINKPSRNIYATILFCCSKQSYTWSWLRLSKFIIKKTYLEGKNKNICWCVQMIQIIIPYIMIISL